MTPAQLLRATRTHRGVSQNALAKLCRASQSSINQIEAGRRPAPASILIAAAVALEAPWLAYAAIPQGLMGYIALYGWPDDEMPPEIQALAAPKKKTKKRR